MPGIAITEIATNNLYQANLLRPGSVYWFGLNADIQQFDFHDDEFRQLSPSRELRLGPVYDTEDEMRYGSRRVDEEGLDRIRTVVAERTPLTVSPAPLK
jgi:hypothetical protein